MGARTPGKRRRHDEVGNARDALQKHRQGGARTCSVEKRAFVASSAAMAMPKRPARDILFGGEDGAEASALTIEDFLLIHSTEGGPSGGPCGGKTGGRSVLARPAPCPMNIAGPAG